MVKGISILGSTGSIGRQTAAAASRLGIPVRALAARRDIDRLEEQCRALRPSMAAVTDEAAAVAAAARVIASGVHPAAVAAMREVYEFLTGEAYTTPEAAERWRAENSEE